jgi:hypothetical protein
VDSSTAHTDPSEAALMLVSRMMSTFEDARKSKPSGFNLLRIDRALGKFSGEIMP